MNKPWHTTLIASLLLAACGGDPIVFGNAVAGVYPAGGRGGPGESGEDCVGQ